MQPLDAYQIAVKLYADTSQRIELSAAVGIFHRWIREERLEDEIPIDVADYRHVKHGPGVILVCHAADYALKKGRDEQNGRLALRYSRKRVSAGDPVTRLQAALRAALTACRLLEKEPSFTGAVRFRADEVSFRIRNRLLAPSTTESAKTLEETLYSFLDTLYQGCERITVETASDPKGLLSATARVHESPDIGRLLSRLRTHAARSRRRPSRASHKDGDTAVIVGPHEFTNNASGDETV